MTKKIISVVGARPNFMKMAPVHKEFISKYPNISHKICHTGQHYDDKMSKIFFNEFKISEPEYQLKVGSGSHAEQTAKIMVEFEKVLLKEYPDLIIVYGDVNSTMACSIVASKIGVKIAHVESGLRSFDMSMPEEINRIVTDRLSDLLFVSEKSGLKNLKEEGIKENKIYFVGNVMIDSLVSFTSLAEKSTILNEYYIKAGQYILVTMHRPSNVDSREFMSEFIGLLNHFSKQYKIIFPIHPRTKNNLNNWQIKFHDNIILTDPIGYVDFLCLIKNSKLIITDSGGIQEESTFLGIQCITIRNNTERPVTVEEGTNILAGTDLNSVKDIINKKLEGEIKEGIIPELWDGKTSQRICKIISETI
jgi:UDP-N-acetylglucosamine 2-epimerase (non-hydrolysing)